MMKCNRWESGEAILEISDQRIADAGQPLLNWRRAGDFFEKRLDCRQECSRIFRKRLVAGVEQAEAGARDAALGRLRIGADGEDRVLAAPNKHRRRPDFRSALTQVMIRMEKAAPDGCVDRDPGGIGSSRVGPSDDLLDERIAAPEIKFREPAGDPPRDKLAPFKPTK